MPTLKKVAQLAKIPPGTAKQIEIGDREIALFNVDGTLHAIGGACTHQGGPLGEGDRDGTVVTCPWHGARFDITNGKVLGPPATSHVPCYRVVVEGDDVKVEFPD